MKKKLLLCLLATTLVVGGCGASESFKEGVEDGINDTLEQNENETSKDDADNSEKESTEESGAISSGSYEIGDLTFNFEDSVRNDSTGKWRISKIAESAESTDYALDYYKTLFSADDEIHAIINFSKNTTTKISVISSELLDVTVQEYVDGEEHDAKLLFSGNLLKEYHINTSTGEIEEIQ